MKNFIVFFIIILNTLTNFTLKGQEQIIDQVIAIVGANIILESDIENQYYQFRMQGNIKGSSSSIKCQIIESLLFQKLLINQAELDSVEITETQVESEMDRRLRYFISQFGSKEKLEEFYQKSIVELKEEFRELIRNQMMVDNAQQKITLNANITPSEVKSFFRKMPVDSLPLINSEVEISQIVLQPPISFAEKNAVKEKLIKFKNRIKNGEGFSTLAILYSEDPGSAKKGGELGLYGRGELFPEFEAVAFKLNPDEISEIVETEAGFHIIQLIERKGEYVNVRHILLKPKVSPLDLAKAKNTLDSIALLIENDSLSFDEAVIKFSDDPSKNNGGLIVNPLTGTTMFEADQLDPKVFFVIDKLQVGDISVPVPMKTKDDKDAYRILFLKKRTLPHRANLSEDYNRIQEWALEEKKSKIIEEWIKNKASKTYIKIVDKYKDCEFQHNWIN
ncbi:MAG: peptidylprolyl isomerase [Bacteroidales bacterium]|nr:peptidylprolyl isomerase [Bacteroidales bacterium]